MLGLDATKLHDPAARSALPRPHRAPAANRRVWSLCDSRLGRMMLCILRERERGA